MGDISQQGQSPKIKLANRQAQRLLATLRLQASSRELFESSSLLQCTSQSSTKQSTVVRSILERHCCPRRNHTSDVSSDHIHIPLGSGTSRTDNDTFGKLECKKRDKSKTLKQSEDHTISSNLLRAIPRSSAQDGIIVLEILLKRQR